MSNERTTSRPSRRDVLKYTGAGVATTSLAGCMSYVQDGSGGGGGGAPAVSGNAGTKFKDETFKLGVLTAPKNTAFGSAMLNSAKMAASEINNSGGIKGASVKILHGNTQLQSAKAKREYRRLTRSENVTATLGTLAGTSLRAILRPMASMERLHLTTASADPIAAKLVSKKVSPIGGNPKEEYQKYKYHFRPGPINTTDLVSAFVEFLKIYQGDLGWQRIGILIENGAGAKQTMNKLRQRASNFVDVPIAKITSSSTTNWTPIYDELENANVDVALVVQVLSGVSSVKQWASQQRPFAFGGIHIRAQLPTFYKETGGAARSVFTMNAVTPRTTNTPHTQPFMNAYKKRFGGVPFFAGPITYDGVRQFAAAVNQSGYHPTEQVDKLVDYMESPEFVFTKGTIIPAFGFRQPNERFAHDPIWDCMTRCGPKAQIQDKNPSGPTGVPVWQQWQKGKNGGVMESFAPESNKTAQYVKPPWMR